MLDIELQASLGLCGANVQANINWDYMGYISQFDIPIVFDTVGAPITPKNLGVVAQYNEEIPNAAYTKGYFYQATGTAVTIPDSATCTETSETGTTITVNASALVTAIADQTEWETDYIKRLLSNSSNAWRYYPNEEQLYWSAYGYMSSDVLACFSFSPTPVSDISWTMTFTPEHQEVQNPAWVQVNVQPGASLPSQTGNAGKFLITDGTDTSWSDKPLVNNSTNLNNTSVSIKGNTGAAGNSVFVGVSSGGIACNMSTYIGYGAAPAGGSGHHNTCVGYLAQTNSNVGGSIQLGQGTNSENGTFYVGLSDQWGTNLHNYKMLNNDGTIPAARLASTTGLADGNYHLRLTMANGVPTLTWVDES